MSTHEHPMVIATTGHSSTERPLEQLSDEEFWEHARKLASIVPVAVLPEEYLECHLRAGRTSFIALAALFEVVPPPYRISLLPAAPPWMPGLIAWRGEVIAVVDLDAYLFRTTSPEPPPPPTGEGTLLIGDLSGQPVGLLVNAIGPITAIEADQVRAYTHAGSDSAAPYKGMYADSFVLDIPALLAEVVRQIEMAATYG
ncbi:MAG: chemotaxis protein CheW [Chloroflexota bacterium]|nr:chemotaxis protein CheW [Chloroflexota bacterium]